MKVLAMVYAIAAINVFGLVASNNSECEEKARDVSKCSVITAIPAAMFWPLYASWVAYDAMEALAGQPPV